VEREREREMERDGEDACIEEMMYYREEEIGSKLRENL
jgi:hypothetical protein